VPVPPTAPWSPASERTIMRAIHCLVVALIVFASTSMQCNVFENGPSHFENVSGKVIVGFSEGYPSGAGEPTIMLTMSSVRIYPCMNYTLLYKLTKSQDSIHLAILGVTIGEICLTALGPAGASTPIELASGAYNVDVDILGSTDRYALVVTNDDIRLTPIDTSVSRLRASHLWRYPRQSFAYYAGTLVEDSSLCTAFADTLRTHLILEEISPPPEGIWPYPLTVGGYYFNSPARFFHYRTEADYDSAGSLLRIYSKAVLKNTSGSSFWLVNWMNKRYLSWILQNQ